MADWYRRTLIAIATLTGVACLIVSPLAQVNYDLVTPSILSTMSGAAGLAIFIALAFCRGVGK